MILIERLFWSGGRFTLDVDVRLGCRVTGIFGFSGAGKSTLLELIAGLRRPLAGAIRVEGETLFDAVVGRHLPPELRQVGYVPQDTALFPHLDVAGNLRFGLPRAPADDGRFAFAHIVELLGLGPLLAARPARLSGGERQRVALGRALLAHPRLLLLDEPLAALDAELKCAILPYLRRVRDEFSLPMLYVSHSAEELFTLCDEVLVLRAGRVVAQGAPATLFDPTEEPRYRLRSSLADRASGSMLAPRSPLA